MVRPVRRLFLAAYDVSDPDRLVDTLRVVRAYACGGQKSAYEVFLTEAEESELLGRVEAILDLEIDRFMLVPVPDPSETRGLGVAEPPADPDFFLIA